MMVKDRYIHKFYVFAMAAVFALVLAGCGGGGGGTAATPDPPVVEPEPTPQEMCEGDGGRYNADGSCTSSEELAVEAERARIAAIAAAVEATEMAAGDAAMALADVEANKAADIESYVKAKIANDKAQAALEAANAATTPAAAQAAQADAEAALVDVQKYAGMVTTAYNAIEAVKMEMAALDAARMAADKAYMDAKALVDTLAVQKDAEPESYNMAVEALADALEAKEAAMNADTSADAEAAQADAEKALEDATKYAAMVTAAHTEATALSTAQGAAMQAYMDAKEALAALTDEQIEADPASHARAEDAVADAKAASDAATAATTSGAAQAAQADADAAKTAADGFIGMVVAAKEAADAEADRIAREEADMAAEAARKEAANEEAMTKIEEMNEESARTETDPSDGNPSSDISVTVKYGDIKVADSTMDDDDDPKFALMDGKYVRDDGDGMVDIVAVHTDIDAPKSTPFAKVSGQTLNATESGGSAAEDDDPFVGLTIEEVQVSAVDSAKAVLSNIMAPRFRAGRDDDPAEAVLTFDADDPGTTNTDESDRISGTYNGASGVYECTGTPNCTITVNSKGEVDAISAGWTFFPAAGATSDVPDSDYLTYGFWITKSTDDEGITTYDKVETFARSSIAKTTGGTIDALLALSGENMMSATYKGNAAGVYGHKTFTPSGEVDTIKAGTFTADVELTANFGTNDDVAVNLQDKIYGTVSDFSLSGDEAQSWSLELDAADIEAGSADFTGGTEGKTTNNWSGTFHGGTEADASAEPPVAIAAPSVVVGEFNGHFTNGHVAGAFGARKEKK